MSRFSDRSDKVKALADVPLFQGLGKKDLAQIAHHVDEVEIPKGSRLVEQGKLAHEVCIILDGKISMTRDGRDVGKLGPGDTLGVMSSIDGEPQNATGVADEECHGLVMTPQDFSTLLESVPSLARRVMVTMSRRLREADSLLDAQVSGGGPTSTG